MPSLDQGIDLIAYDQVGRVVLLAEAKSRGEHRQSGGRVFGGTCSRTGRFQMRRSS
jgi:hypothetical protein